MQVSVSTPTPHSSGKISTPFACLDTCLLPRREPPWVRPDPSPGVEAAGHLPCLGCVLRGLQRMTPLGQGGTSREASWAYGLTLTDALIMSLIKPRVTSAGTDPPLPAPSPSEGAALPLPAAGSCLLVPVAKISLLLPLQESSRAGFLIPNSSLQPSHPRPTHRSTLPPNNVERDCLRDGGGSACLSPMSPQPWQLSWGL